MNFFLEKLNFYFIIFCILFGCVFYDFIGISFSFTYTDELIATFLFLYWLAIGKKQTKEFYIVIFIFIFYLIGALFFPHNKQAAIWMDFFIEIKPFIAFYTVYNLNLYISPKHRRKICRLCIILSILLLPIGLINPGGGIYMNALGGHARFATIHIILGTTYLYYSHRTKRDLYIALLIYSIGLLSLRSKMFGFFTLFTCVMFLWSKLSNKHLLSLRTLFLGSLAAVAIVFVAWEKISFYFVEGTIAQSMYARPYLYMKSWEILNDYPLFGSGLGSYATYASAVYYSPLYMRYKMYLNYEIGNGLFICDTFFPALAQFGYIGILLFICFWKKRIDQAIKNMRITKDVFPFKIVIVIIGFFFMESIADSTFTHNRGMIMMMLLALFLKTRKIKRIKTRTV